MTAGDALKPVFAKCKKVALLGVGSELRLDDFVGMYLAELLEPFADGENVVIVKGATAPENCTGIIRQLAPDMVIVFDAARMGLSPGESMVLDPEKITGMTFSTHMLPLPVMLSYLETACSCGTAYVGIEPLCTGQGIGMDGRVKAGAEQLARELAPMVKALCK